MKRNKLVENRRFLRTVEGTVSKYRMFEKGDPVLVGVSGGPDSVALLHALMAMAPKLSIRLAVAHLHHGLRGKESDRDKDFSEAIADSHDLPFYCKKTDVPYYGKQHKLSLEEAGRHLRYQFFEEIAQKNGFKKIALGHNAEDNAEDVLIYLLRGSGPLGLAGIPPIRDNRIVRPLIALTRSEIMNFLSSNGIEYVSDSSNADLRYLRNRIRHQLVPHLKSTYNPNVIEALNRLSNIMRDEESWSTEIIISIFNDVSAKSEKKRIHLSILKFNALHAAVKRRILRLSIERVKGDLKKITFAHIDKIIKLCESGPVYGRLDLPDRIRIERDTSAVLFSKRAEPLRQSAPQNLLGSASIFQYRISRPKKGRPEKIWIAEMGGYLELSEISVKKIPDIWEAGQQVAFFDINNMRFPLIVRNVQPGDRFTPFGMKGTQKINDFFTNNKVPRTDRSKCPVLVSGEKIVWVVGYRIDDSVKITRHTQKLLKAEVLLA